MSLRTFYPHNKHAYTHIAINHAVNYKCNKFIIS